MTHPEDDTVEDQGLSFEAALTGGRVYTKEDMLDIQNSECFYRVGYVRMVRMHQPFWCKTIDGNVVHCEDGWLAEDAAGHPYPIDDEVQRRSYRRMEDSVPASPLTWLTGPHNKEND